MPQSSPKPQKPENPKIEIRAPEFKIAAPKPELPEARVAETLNQLNRKP